MHFSFGPALKSNERPTLQERFAALRYVPPLVKLVWETHRAFTATMAVLRLMRAGVPVAMLWVGKLIIDSVVASRGSSPDYSRLWKLVALEIAIVTANDVLARTSSLVESLLGDLFSNHTSVRLMEHAATLDLAHFEDPAFYDHLERARRQTTSRIGLLAQLLAIGQDGLTLISLGAALVVYSPWLLLLLAVAVLPSFFGETHFAALDTRCNSGGRRSGDSSTICVTLLQAIEPQKRFNRSGFRRG
jgi:ATP-binding cassette subfamily B protein